MSGNTGGLGAGGIFIYTNVAAQIINSTITDNEATTGGPGGIDVSKPTTGTWGTPTLTLEGSIVARSRSDDVDLKNDTVPIPAFVVSGNNSMVQRACGNCNITFSGTGNLPNQDPLLAPLAFNGGLTRSSTRRRPTARPSIPATTC